MQSNRTNQFRILDCCGVDSSASPVVSGSDRRPLGLRTGLCETVSSADTVTFIDNVSVMPDRRFRCLLTTWNITALDERHKTLCNPLLTTFLSNFFLQPLYNLTILFCQFTFFKYFHISPHTFTFYISQIIFNFHLTSFFNLIQSTSNFHQIS